MSIIDLPSRYAVAGNAAALTVVFNAELTAATAATTRVRRTTTGIATNCTAGIVGRRRILMVMTVVVVMMPLRRLHLNGGEI